MNNFGQKVRVIRESKSLLLRQAAAFLEVDTAFLSNVELGKKKATRQQADKLADFLEVDKSELVPLWLSDRILDLVQSEPYAKITLEITLNIIDSTNE